MSELRLATLRRGILAPVMSAIRLPLLCAFAGGCLSNAVLFGLWRVAGGAADSPAPQRHSSYNVVELATAANAGPSTVQPSERVAAAAATTSDRGLGAATGAAPTAAAPDLDNAGPTPAGSAVSDVLTQLETAYRERVAARAPAQPASTAERVTPTAAAPADEAVAAAEATVAVPTQRVADVIPAAPAFAPPVAVAPAPVAVAPAPVAAAPAFAPQVAVAPVVSGPDAPPPTEIHYGDVNQNTYITNVREGDVYLVQMQQVAMLQYMQLLGMSSGLAAPTRHVGGRGRQRGTLSTGITNPDNPWGFQFAPPNLVR